MPYFFLLPVAGAIVVLLGGFAAVCRIAPPLRPLFPFAWRILLWSTVGIAAANGAVLLLYLLPGLAPEGLAADPRARGLLQISLAAGLLVGPIVATALGFMAGSTLGVFLALRSLRERREGAGERRAARLP